jgi:hypothetical protein
MNRHDSIKIIEAKQPKIIDSINKGYSAPKKYFEVHLIINTQPSKEWIEFFNAPSTRWSFPVPQNYQINGTIIVFTSEESEFQNMIEILKKYIDQANMQYAMHIKEVEAAELRRQEHEAENTAMEQQAKKKLEGLI